MTVGEPSQEPCAESSRHGPTATPYHKRVSGTHSRWDTITGVKVEIRTPPTRGNLFSVTYAVGPWPAPPGTRCRYPLMVRGTITEQLLFGKNGGALVTLCVGRWSTDGMLASHGVSTGGCTGGLFNRSRERHARTDGRTVDSCESHRLRVHGLCSTDGRLFGLLNARRMAAAAILREAGAIPSSRQGQECTDAGLSLSARNDAWGRPLAASVVVLESLSGVSRSAFRWEPFFSFVLLRHRRGRVVLATARRGCGESSAEQHVWRGFGVHPVVATPFSIPCLWRTASRVSEMRYALFRAFENILPSSVSRRSCVSVGRL